jgi:hypothetical protein
MLVVHGKYTEVDVDGCPNRQGFETNAAPDREMSQKNESEEITILDNDGEQW